MKFNIHAGYGAQDSKSPGVVGLIKESIEARKVNVESFKNWLKLNLVTVVYQLAEEEIYECLPIPVESYKGETIYRIESGDIPPVSSFEFDYTLNNTVNRVLDVKTFNNAMIVNIKTNLTKIKEVI